jgi:AcrR family transcriptional regulator
MTTPTKRLRPRKTPRQTRSVETRARLLDAAARVFSRHGYAAGTTNRIAEEAGMSVGSLYQYFPNKDAILVELLRAHVDAGAEALRRRLAPLRVQGGEPVDRRAVLAAAVDAMVANHVDDPALHQVLFEEAPRPPELLAELHALEDEAVAVVQALLDADPEIRIADSATVARMVVVTMESVVHRLVATRTPTVDPGAVATELTTMLDRYLTGDPARPA